jgi:hypothetical protein
MYKVAQVILWWRCTPPFLYEQQQWESSGCKCGSVLLHKWRHQSACSSQDRCQKRFDMMKPTWGFALIGLKSSLVRLITSSRLWLPSPRPDLQSAPPHCLQNFSIQTPRPRLRST